MNEKGFAVADFEHEMQDLRACKKLIQDDSQALIAPGVKFGKLSGNRALNSQNFKEQVLECGGELNTMRSGQRNEKSYYGRMLRKLNVASRQLEIKDDGIEVQLQMPSIRSVKVAKRELDMYDISDQSSLLTKKNAGVNDISLSVAEGVLDDESAILQLTPLEIVRKAQKGKPLVEEYTVKLLTEMVQHMGRQYKHVNSDIDTERSFTQYMRNLLLYVEGKNFSQQANLATMAQRLSDYEEDASFKIAGGQYVHTELRDIWSMIKMLDQAIPLDQRPSTVDVIISMADQRKAVAGVVAKDPLECRLASVSCWNLESLYRNYAVDGINVSKENIGAEYKGQS